MMIYDTKRIAHQRTWIQIPALTFSRYWKPEKTQKAS